MLIYRMIQTEASPGKPYYLPYRFVDRVSFTKLTSPPLSYLDKGVLYEMVDGKLYFNGQPLATGDSFINESTNRILYVSPETGESSNNGNILTPVKTIAEAMALVPDKTGYSINFSYTDSSDFAAKTGVGIYGSQILDSFLHGTVTINDSSWLTTTGGPNQLLLSNLVILGFCLFDFENAVIPMIICQTCSIVSVFNVSGYYDVSNSFRSQLILSNSYILTNMLISNCDVLVTNCCSVAGGTAQFSISKTDSEYMSVYIDFNNNLGNSSIFIDCNAGSSGTVDVSVCGNNNLIQITVDPTSTCNIILKITSDTRYIFNDSFSEFSTTLQFFNNSFNTNYNPTTPSDWSPLPNNVGKALDILAPEVNNKQIFLNGVTTITGANQNITSGNNLTPYFSATDDYFDYIANNTNFYGFYYHLSRNVDITESVNIRLIINGSPVVSFGPLTNASPVEAIVPFNQDIPAGSKIYILINAFAAVSNIIMSWSLIGKYINP